jgi:DNA recombination protein RmuC
MNAVQYRTTAVIRLSLQGSIKYDSIKKKKSRKFAQQVTTTNGLTGDGLTGNGMPALILENYLGLILAAAGALFGGALAALLMRTRLVHAHERRMAAAQMDQRVLLEKLQAHQQIIEQLRARTAQLNEEGGRYRQRSVELQAANAALDALAAERASQLAGAEAIAARREEHVASLQQLLTRHTARIAELSTVLEEERKHASEKIALLNGARDQLKNEFQNLANRIFEEKSHTFVDKNRTAVDHLIGPLRDQIVDFKRRVEDVYDKESRDRTAWHAEITHLKELNQRIGQEALNLTRALKGDSKVRGNWGEVILERVLEASGLQKGREYDVQVSLTDSTGKRYQPDVVVRLPEGKHVIIDAKVSLKDYEAFYCCEEPQEKEQHLLAHIEAVRTHIRTLAAKSYEALEGVCSLDFTLIFIPIEAAFLSAVEKDGTLFIEAFEKNIVLVGPSTLLVTLRTIQNIWRHEYQNRNALEIAKKAGGLYDKFVGFVESLEEVGRQLGKARDAYRTAHTRLVDGKGSLLKRSQELKALGVKAGKELPAKLLESIDQEEADDRSFSA